MPPPRSSTSSTPSPYQQYFKQRMSPATAPPSRNGQIQSQSPARGASPVAPNNNLRQGMLVQGRTPGSQQQTQLQSLSLYQNGSSNIAEPPPPYPITPLAPPSYTASIHSRQSPTQDYRKSPSSGIYSGTSVGSASSPSPITVSQGSASHNTINRPIPLPASWTSSRQTKTQHPIIMHSVKSTQVQKPILQTAVAPVAPSTVSTPTSLPQAPPSYSTSWQQKQVTLQTPPQTPPIIVATSSSSSTKSPPSTPGLPSSSNNGGTSGNNSPTIHTAEPPPSYATMMALRAQHPPPPPPYSNNPTIVSFSPSCYHFKLNNFIFPLAVNQ